MPLSKIKSGLFVSSVNVRTCSCIMSGYPSQANHTRHSHALMNERKAAWISKAQSVNHLHLTRARRNFTEFGLPNLSRPDVVPPVQKVEDGGRRPERVEHLSLRPGKRLFAHVDLHSNMQWCHFGAQYDVECPWPLAMLSISIGPWRSTCASHLQSCTCITYYKGMANE